MAEVELLGQDLLDVLPSFDGEAAVGHHEVDALALRLRQDKLFKLEEVVFAENVPVALLAPHSVVSLEALGCNNNWKNKSSVFIYSFASTYSVKRLHNSRRVFKN